MTHPSFILTVLLTLVAAQADRPNIVLFLVDDLGWQDTSLVLHTEPTPFNERYRTPALESLAARGMRFTNAYASAPVCTPTRTSIMTGRSPARSRITYWTLHKDRDNSKKRDDIEAPAWNMNGLQKGDITLPLLLRNAGYRTIHAGKAHFGAHDTSGSDPSNLGFVVNIAGHASGGPASFYGTHHFTVAGRRGEDPTTSKRTVWDIPGLEKYHGQDIYLTEALAIEACAAVRASVSDGKPFFLHFAPYAVHAPIMANEKLLPHYPDLDAREAAYATMIETVDNALASIVETLDELEQLDNTIIIYSSDNGGLSAHARGPAPDGQPKHTHNAPLRSGKGSAYEGGMRVPTVISWPGVTTPDSVSNTPVISHDFFPTILAAAEVGIPDSHEPGVDGRDLGPLLRGTTFEDRVLGWNQPHQWGASGPGIWPFTSLRSGRLKLIYFHAGRRLELYDLVADPGETNDLAADQPQVVQELTQRLDAWISKTGAQLSIDKATGEPVELPGAIAARR